LLLHDIPAYLQQRVGVGAVEGVIFIQQSMREFSYRDAVRFSSGREILLQYLLCGQQVDVMSLSSGGSVEEEAAHQRREEEYCRVFVG